MRSGHIPESIRVPSAGADAHSLTCVPQDSQGRAYCERGGHAFASAAFSMTCEHARWQVMISVGILTASTKGAAGKRDDTSGDAIEELVTAPPLAATVAERAIVADERAAIEAVLRHWADDLRLNLILTTGGTGLNPTDVTPEATLAGIQRLEPRRSAGIRPENMRHTPLARRPRPRSRCRGPTP